MAAASRRGKAGYRYWLTRSEPLRLALYFLGAEGVPGRGGVHSGGRSAGKLHGGGVWDTRGSQQSQSITGSEQTL